MKIDHCKLNFYIFLFLFTYANQGISGNIYSDMAMGSRYFALGQSATMSYSDILSAINNPSSLLKADNITSLFYYSEPFENTKNIGAGIAYSPKGYGTFGFSYFNFILDKIVERNEFNYVVGSSSWSQKEFILSYSHIINNKFVLGYNAKYINDQLSGSQSSILQSDNIGLDLSLGFCPNSDNIWFKNLGIGMVMGNIIQLNDKNDHLPKEIRGIVENGYESLAHSIYFVMNVSYLENAIGKYQTMFHIGMEYGYKITLLRLGYNNDSINFGSGLHYQFLSLDYAYGYFIKDGHFNRSMHNFTLSIDF